MPGGRPKKPTALLKLIGATKSLEWRKDSPAIETKPGVLERPATLPEFAAGAWAEVVAAICEQGIESRVDAIAVECLANAVAQHRRCAATVAENGGIVEYITNGGAVKRGIAPEATLLLQFGKQMASLSDRLGLTPAAREPITQAKPQQEPVSFARPWAPPPGGQ